MIDNREYFQKAMNKFSEKLEDLLNKESVKFTSNIVDLPKEKISPIPYYTKGGIDIVGENIKHEIIVDKFGKRQGTFKDHIRLNKNEIDFLKSFINKKTH